MASVGPVMPSGMEGRGSTAGYVHRQRSPGAFQHLLQSAVARSHGHTRIANTGATQAAFAVPLSAPAGQPAATTPSASGAALQRAMTLEGVPQSWQASLQFIMAHESGGQVDAKSPVHSARGLFQLTAANYHYNPNGAASFGNAVEEAQGGIRYISQRYGSAENAAAFWRQHRWY
jgi:hypothetical protein